MWFSIALAPVGNDGPTQTSQAVTFAIIGGLITILTLLLNSRSKAQAEHRANEQVNKAEDRANQQFLEREAVRLKEKQEDLAAAIAKEERDNARQDIVAARVGGVAVKVEEVAVKVEETTSKTLVKLDDVEKLGKVTHALVNSDKTASMRDTRDGLIVTLALMHEVIELKKLSGKEPSESAVNAIEALEQRIKSLTKTIDERLSDQHQAEQRNVIDGRSDEGGEAADKQLVAAGQQQEAAKSQQSAADQISKALGTGILPPPPPPKGA